MIEFSQSADGEISMRLGLNAWQGTRDASGPYASSRDESSDGLVEVILRRVSASGEFADKPTDDELHAVAFLQENQLAIADALTAAVFETYPSIRRWLQDCGVAEDELAEIAPAVEGIKGIRGLIGLGTVFVLPPGIDGTPYFGLELGCSWDEEHGLGAVFCGTELIEIGSADIAFDGSLPSKDGILRNLLALLAASRLNQQYTLRRQAHWKYMPWGNGPWPDLGIHDSEGHLLVAVDVVDFHWEGPSRWWMNFVQYRNEPVSFARLTIGPTRAGARVWKRQTSDGQDWAPVREATGSHAVIALDEIGISVALEPLYAGIASESRSPAVGGADG